MTLEDTDTAPLPVNTVTEVNPVSPDAICPQFAIPWADFPHAQ